jgi:hypothetical protein
VEALREELQLRPSRTTLTTAALFKDLAAKSDVSRRRALRRGTLMIDSLHCAALRQLATLGCHVFLAVWPRTQVPLAKDDFDAAVRELANEPAALFVLHRNVITMN